ncbi:MAG: hypothetical protein ACYTGE_13340 [Planctomycetota bacterium]|jgi:hypothetical protein
MTRSLGAKKIGSWYRPLKYMFIGLVWIPKRNQPQASWPGPPGKPIGWYIGLPHVVL